MSKLDMNLCREHEQLAQIIQRVVVKVIAEEEDIVIVAVPRAAVTNLRIHPTTPQKENP